VEIPCRIYPHARLIDWSFAAVPDEVQLCRRQRSGPFARTDPEMLHRKLEQNKLVERRLVCSKNKENSSD
jgi:hypothetical protein